MTSWGRQEGVCLLPRSCSSSLGWSARSHVEFRGNHAEKGGFIACKIGKSRFYSCFKVIFEYNFLQLRCVCERPEVLVAQNLWQENFR